MHYLLNQKPDMDCKHDYKDNIDNVLKRTYCSHCNFDCLTCYHQFKIKSVGSLVCQKCNYCIEYPKLTKVGRSLATLKFQSKL